MNKLVFWSSNYMVSSLLVTKFSFNFFSLYSSIGSFEPRVWIWTVHLLSSEFWLIYRKQNLIHFHHQEVQCSVFEVRTYGLNTCWSYHLEQRSLIWSCEEAESVLNHFYNVSFDSCFIVCSSSSCNVLLFVSFPSISFLMKFVIQFMISE